MTYNNLNKLLNTNLNDFVKYILKFNYIKPIYNSEYIYNKLIVIIILFIKAYNKQKKELI